MASWLPLVIDDGRDDDDDEKTKKWRKEPLGNRNDESVDVRKKHKKKLQNGQTNRPKIEHCLPFFGVVQSVCRSIIR